MYFCKIFAKLIKDTKNKSIINLSSLSYVMANKIKKSLLSSHKVLLSIALAGIILFDISSIQASLVVARSQTPSIKKVSSKKIVASPTVAFPASKPSAAVTPTLTSTAVKTTPKHTVASTYPRVTVGTKAEPVVVPSPSSSVSTLTPVAPVAVTTPNSTTTPTPTTTAYTSSNWSGYMDTVGSFNEISGSWTATSPYGISNVTSADSCWIGIGGVSSSDLIQVGTQNTISTNGQVFSSAFYELLPNVSQTVPGVTVTPGDSMTASLTEVSSGQWTISITDKTDGQSYTSTVSYASSNSSAEWIEEDPSYSSRRQIPFDNFVMSVFSGGTTSLNDTSDSIQSSNAQPITMVGSMTDQTLATPSAITADGFGFSVARNNTSSYD
jgi:hypothetical protein